jgi:hypothetical protein
MYYAPKEHNPPHIHVFYQGEESTFELKSGNLIEGKIPNNKQKLVEAWIELRREDLMADWELCQNGEQPFKIEGLK